MKFSQYASQVNPNTIQGQVQRPGDLNSYGGNGAGYEAIGRGLGAVNEAYQKFILIRQLFRCVLQLFHGQSSEVRKEELKHTNNNF